MIHKMSQLFSNFLICTNDLANESKFRAAEPVIPLRRCAGYQKPATLAGVVTIVCLEHTKFHLAKICILSLFTLAFGYISK